MKDMYLDSSSQVAQSERVINYLYNLVLVFLCLTVAVGLMCFMVTFTGSGRMKNVDSISH
jgi:hypothetical protein